MKIINSIVLLFALVSPGLASEPVDFSLPGLDGRHYQLSDFRGKWVLINFWATWCPPCLEEMPELEIFHNSHKDRDAVVWGVNMEDIAPEKLRRFIDEQFVSYPILLMREGARSPLGRISGLPTSFLISPDGRIMAKQVGTVTASAIENFIANYRK